MWDFHNNKEYGNQRYDTVISDPIWGMPYGVRQKFGYMLREFLKPNGTLILNAPFIVHVKGLKLEKVYYREGYITWANTALLSIYKQPNHHIDN